MLFERGLTSQLTESRFDIKGEISNLSILGRVCGHNRVEIPMTIADESNFFGTA